MVTQAPRAAQVDNPDAALLRLRHKLLRKLVRRGEEQHIRLDDRVPIKRTDGQIRALQFWVERGEVLRRRRFLAAEEPRLLRRRMAQQDLGQLKSGITRCADNGWLECVCHLSKQLLQTRYEFRRVFPVLGNEEDGVIAADG